MNKLRIVVYSFLLIVSSVNVFSQTITEPNFGLKSHETLEIKKIELTESGTVVYLSIENKITGGNFCADKNVFLIESDGTRRKLLKAKGIPACPETYTFKNIGEKLQFSLEFPPVKKGTVCVDIIEECSQNCFSFYGVTLDETLNNRLNEALSTVDKGQHAKALSLYKEILKNQPVNGISGSIYSDIITLSVQIGDKTGAEEWYKKLMSSTVPRKDLYIKNLNSAGIKF
jgi:hypothetical protein